MHHDRIRCSCTLQKMKVTMTYRHYVRFLFSLHQPLSLRILLRHLHPDESLKHSDSRLSLDCDFLLGDAVIGGPWVSYVTFTRWRACLPWISICVSFFSLCRSVDRLDWIANIVIFTTACSTIFPGFGCFETNWSPEVLMKVEIEVRVLRLRVGKFSDKKLCLPIQNRLIEYILKLGLSEGLKQEMNIKWCLSTRFDTFSVGRTLFYTRYCWTG